MDYNDDPMGMGGNNILAAARREAKAHGYQNVSGLTSMNSGSAGV